MPTTDQVPNGPMIRPFFRLLDANIPIDLMSCLAEVDEYFEALENDGTEVSFSDGTYDSEDDWEAEEDAFISKLEAADSPPKKDVEDPQPAEPPVELSLQDNPAAKRIYRRLLLQLLWPLSDPDINILQVYENTKVIDPDYHQTDFHRKIELWRTLSVIRQQLDAVKEDNYRLQTMRLNIEFYMYKSFEEEFEGYSMARNPFMVHWLEFIDGEIMNPEDRILVYFIRGLLKGHSQKVGPKLLSKTSRSRLIICASSLKKQPRGKSSQTLTGNTTWIPNHCERNCHPMTSIPHASPHTE